MPVADDDGGDSEESYSSDEMLKRRKGQLVEQVKAGLNYFKAVSSATDLAAARKKAKTGFNTLTDAMTTLDSL